MELDDAVGEGGGGAGRAFADGEEFLRRMDAILPMVDRSDAGDDLDAGGEFFRDDGPGGELGAGFIGE